MPFHVAAPRFILIYHLGKHFSEEVFHKHVVFQQDYAARAVPTYPA